MTGEEIRQAREARHWTQDQLAQRIGVGMRTIGNWERGETVPQNRMGALQRVFDIESSPDANPLGDFSDVALLQELTRRAVDRRQQ